MPPLCKVCTSPHRESIEFYILSREKSHPEIARLYGMLKDSVGRHARNHMQKRADILAVVDGSSSPPAAKAREALTTTQNAILDKAESLLERADEFYEKFKGSENARDVKAALDSVRDSLRLVGELAGSFPKPTSTTNVDARSITLQGLSTDDLRHLITGLKAFSEAQHPEAHALSK
jgi:hypothetical protein